MSDIFAVFFPFNFPPTDWTMPIGIFGGSKVLAERFLNKICKKYKVPHKKLPSEQIKPYQNVPPKYHYVF